MPAISTGLAIGLGVAAAAGSAGSAAIKAHAAGKAAGAQATAAQQAQQLIAGGQKNSQSFLDSEWKQQQLNEQPYQALGQTSANHLADIINNPFKAPTLEEARNTPGYQFQLEQGVGALDQSAAARGNLFSGTQGTALEKYGQGLADSTYNDVYNRALGTYMTNYNTAMGGTNVGQIAAGQLGAEGSNAVSENTAINLGGAEAQAQQINNAAAARASGYVGAGNAWGGAVASGAGDATDLLLLNAMRNNGTSYAQTAAGLPG